MVTSQIKLGVINSEGSKVGQNDHSQHNTHPWDTDNNRAVSQRADCERKYMVEGQFHSIAHSMVFNPYASGTLVNAYHSGKQENKILDQQVKGSVLGQRGLMVKQGHNKGYETPKN